MEEPWDKRFHCQNPDRRVLGKQISWEKSRQIFPEQNIFGANQDGRIPRQNISRAESRQKIFGI